MAHFDIKSHFGGEHPYLIGSGVLPRASNPARIEFTIFIYEEFLKFLSIASLDVIVGRTTRRRVELASSIKL